MSLFSKENIFLVTGASSGIGKETALMINKNGGFVIATGRDEAKLRVLLEECENPNSMAIEPKNLSQNIDTLSEWVKELKDKYGKIESLICCAGITATEPLKLIDYNKSKEIMDINYFAPIMLAKGFADKRVNSGVNNAIIFVSSVAGSIGKAGLSMYSGSKGALIASMKSLNKELQARNIRVNTVSPGMIDTPMLQYEIEQGYIQADKSYIGQASDVANTILFLISSSGRWISGQDIIINGGGIVK